MAMASPFQLLLRCPQTHSRKFDVILAASGGSIHSFDASNGSHLSCWTLTTSSTPATSLEAVTEWQAGDEKESTEPATKKRKLSHDSTRSPSPSPEIIVEGEGKRASRRKNIAKPAPFVLKLCRTSDSRHIVAVTSEDKCVRVFELLGDGVLHLWSERIMPKRPSSITLTPDDNTLLCADKFGDVYALPLLGLLYEQPQSMQCSQMASTEEQSERTTAATPLTVHTKKNQIALQNQLRVKKKEKQVAAPFEYQLLLGHVSLLTDLVHIAVSKESDGVSDLSVTKTYILTADRDEHIRVSRGQPQSHIIEGFCLGHTQFITKLCVPPWNPELLISAGGDDFLLTWDWQCGQIRQKVMLRKLVDELRAEMKATMHQDSPPENEEAQSNHVTVSGIWIVSSSPELALQSSRSLIIGFEGISALLIFNFATDDILKYHKSVLCRGNVLDVMAVAGDNSILYSMDSIHEPGSTKKLVGLARCPPLGYFDLESNTEQRDHTVSVNSIDVINQWTNNHQDNERERTDWSVHLYGKEHLRKRGVEIE